MTHSTPTSVRAAAESVARADSAEFAASYSAAGAGWQAAAAGRSLEFTLADTVWAKNHAAAVEAGWKARKANSETCQDW